MKLLSNLACLPVLASALLLSSCTTTTTSTTYYPVSNYPTYTRTVTTDVMAPSVSYVGYDGGWYGGTPDYFNTSIIIDD